MTNRVNHRDDLIKVNSNLKFIRSIDESCKFYRSLHDSSGLNSQLNQSPGGFSLSVSSQPQLLTPNSVKKIYQSNNWKEIKKLQDQSDNDLNAIYTNFRNHPNNCWNEVEDDTTGEHYFMSWDVKGNYVWTYCASVNTINDPFNPQGKFSGITQYGVFSKTTSICGIHSYNLTTPTLLVESVFSLILSNFISKLVKQGINFLSSSLVSLISEAAADAGLDAVFTIASAALGFICSCVVFAIVFIGISYLWNFLNKRFQICVSIYNWDTVNDCLITKQSLSNAINPGQDLSTNLSIKINKQLPAGSTPSIPGFGLTLPPDIGQMLIKTTESVVAYAFIVYENLQTFLQGCSFSFSINFSSKQNSGFTYAFQCPWVASNGHYIENTIQDPSSFLKKARSNWVSSTNALTTNVEYIPINCFIDSLTGGDADGSDNYQVVIHIGNQTN
ncbi:hypothetical protein CYY_003723 [Polysphondylium violaceum]|uniref:Uncharacterized protein n=1 Tax=Polysphondylium violaceum TaxID=133409 RepID=A0A8J4V8F4_9MYCE|nr:hypothetical protein CYY_003723 [Polysphondylium violaceum]